MNTVKELDSTGFFPVKFNVYSGGVITPHCVNVNVRGFTKNDVDGNGMSIQTWMQSLLEKLVITTDDWAEHYKNLHLYFDPLEVERTEFDYIFETIFYILNSLLPITELDYEAV